MDSPVRFRAATHAYVSRLTDLERRQYLAAIAVENAAALVDVLRYCRELAIGAFRIPSGLFPLATHPVSGYGLEALANADDVRAHLIAARDCAAAAGIRLSFHPDQFIVLNSVHETVVASSVAELEWQAELAEVVGADVICLHGGSTFGGADEAIGRLLAGIDRLTPRTRTRLALENDDRCFSAIELLPACLAADVPLVLDAHHHRVLDGGLSIDDATDWALATWGEREPHFHVSSPRAGWGSEDPRPHADYIEPDDVPAYWIALGDRLTVDVEAKAKERAILAIRRQIERRAG